MNALSQAIGRLAGLALLALLLWALDRAVSWMGLTSTPLTPGHAATMACGFVLLMWVVKGKVGEIE